MYGVKGWEESVFMYANNEQLFNSVSLCNFVFYFSQDTIE
jgi:hypothetical protein